MKSKGFTLIELMIVVAIIAIIAAIAIPSLLRSRMAANQTAAAAACKSFAAAEEIYRRTDYNTDGILEYSRNLRGNNSLLENASGANDLGLVDGTFAGAEGTLFSGGTGGGGFAFPAPVPKAGYCFGVLTSQGSAATGGSRTYIQTGRMILGYAFSALPASWDNTGRETFTISNNGTIFQNDRGSAASVTHVTFFNPLAGTWVPTE